MKVNWGNVPIELCCPKCMGEEDHYENLKQDEWKFLMIKTPEPLKDYHKCPQCNRMWQILKPHTDEV